MLHICLKAKLKEGREEERREREEGKGWRKDIGFFKSEKHNPTPSAFKTQIFPNGKRK